METTIYNNSIKRKYSEEDLFADRMQNIPRSFIREILKLASKNDVISFAGGVPNPDYFPIDGIKEAAMKVLTEEGPEALQYSTTEGYYPLRQFISERYKSIRGLDISPEEILITNGSQQGLDLIGKVFLNEGDGVLIEKPSYLGAIQSLSAYQPTFYSADLHPDGIDIDQASTILSGDMMKLFYTIPDFHNPTGYSYSSERRSEVSEIIQRYSTLIIEDHPYEELRFEGERSPSFMSFLPKQTLLLGSFSKIVAPGLRLGWIACKNEFMEKLVIAKQAADLHSNYFSQMILNAYLRNSSLDEHIATICKSYKEQRNDMIHLIHNYFSHQIKFTHPKGGLFLWITLPDYCNATEILKEAIANGVAYVPGETFFQNGEGKNTIRLSYSKLNFSEMRDGILKLSNVLNKYIK